MQVRSKDNSPKCQMQYHRYVILHKTIRNTLNTFLMYQNTKSKIWDIFVYQFHIKAKKGIQRNPTPEGIHKDGHIFISMHMIGQPNIESGTSYI